MVFSPNAAICGGCSKILNQPGLAASHSAYPPRLSKMYSCTTDLVVPRQFYVYDRSATVPALLSPKACPDVPYAIWELSVTTTCLKHALSASTDQPSGSLDMLTDGRAARRKIEQAAEMNMDLHSLLPPTNRNRISGPQASAIVLLFLIPLLDPLSSLCDLQPIWARCIPIELLCTCCSPPCIRQSPSHTLDQSPCSPPKHKLLLDHLLHSPPARTVRRKVSSHPFLIDVITRAFRLADFHLHGTLPGKQASSPPSRSRLFPDHPPPPSHFSRPTLPRSIWCCSPVLRSRRSMASAPVNN